ETKYARQHYRLPDNIIVIGNNGGGDTLVYQIGADGVLDTTVYWLDHETDQLNRAAEDFSDLKTVG
ncbi:MAG: SMI1/KNR4 family protein, partial [Akkermansiaceae bacterium]